MDDPVPEKGKRVSSLTSAIRAARLDEAERSQAVGDLRGAEVARLGLLREAIEPVLGEIPADVTMFDVGIATGGERPRLFIDMISFVEMGRDRRAYRFVQDTRHGRVLLAESENIGAMTTALTAYIARRLVEREQTLAALLDDGLVARPLADATRPLADATRPGRDPPRRDAEAPISREAPAAPPPDPIAEALRPTGFGRVLVRALRIGIDGLGILTLAGLVWLVMQYVQGRFPPRW